VVPVFLGFIPGLIGAGIGIAKKLGVINGGPGTDLVSLSTITCGPGFKPGRNARGEPTCVAFVGDPRLNLGGVVPGNGGGTPCPPGTVRDPMGAGFCVSGASPFGRGRGAEFDFGTAELGRFGAGLNPAVITTATRKCPRGAVLGLDGLCYNKSSLKNSDRMWPMGTRPLLTGGEMRCIRIASSAANKLRRKEKQLRSMGMLPALPKARRAKALAPGHHAHVAHN